MCIVCLPQCPVLYLKKVLGPKRCIFWYECWCQWRLIWNYSSVNINPTWRYTLVICNLKRNILMALIKLISSQSVYTTCISGGAQAPRSHAIVFQWLCVSTSVVWSWSSTTIYGQFPSALIGHSMSLACISQSITIHTVAMSIIYGQTPSAVVVLTHYSILLHYWVYHLPLCSTELVITTSLRVEELHSGRL